MKVACYTHQGPDKSPEPFAFAEGLRRHGVSVEMFSSRECVPVADFLCAWGWRNCVRWRREGQDVLVMERGYIGDRFSWTSLGWGGLNGRAEWNEPADNGERFEKNFGHMVGDWCRGDGYALIVGQVRGDASLTGVDIDAWYEKAEFLISTRGYDVRLREHPVAIQQGKRTSAMQGNRLTGTLEEALAGASIVVTYNSNTGVESVLAGIPTIVCDIGAMAWPVAAHGLDAEIVTPDRTDWFRRMAWRQWTLEEISSGLAWEYVGKSRMERLAA